MSDAEILVTGAGGFLGRHIVARLESEGLTCLTPTRADCDLADNETVGSFLSGRRVRAVVHAAARIPGRGDDTLEAMARDNLIATENLLGATAEVARFVFLSSLDVYGEPRETTLTESSPTDPVTHYAITKLAAEKLVQAWARENDVSHCILRLSHVYGPGDRPIKLIPKTVETVGRNEVPVVFGDGSALRDYIHARDVARAVRAALRSRATGVFNVASGESKSVRQVVRMVLKAGGRPEGVALRPQTSRSGDIRVDATRMREELGFEPVEDMSTALRELVANLVT